MAQETIPVQGLGTSAAPLTYPVAVGDAFDLMAAFASFDGTAAASSWVPALQVLAPSGAVMASTIGATVAAGGSADVTFAPFLENDTTTTSTGGTPSVATFWRSANGGDANLTVHPDNLGTVGIPWLHASLPSDGTITGPFTGNVFVQFNSPGMVIEFLTTQWDAPGYLKASVLGTNERVIEADQFSLGTAGTGASTATNFYGDTTSYVRANAHIANDLIHAYAANGDVVNHDIVAAFLVIYFWPATGYTGGVPGWPA